MKKMIIRKFHRLARWAEVSSEVKLALETNRPVVALESTIITHGMPYPENEETALQVEKTVRDQNAVPATVAIVKGKLKIGLTPQEIHILASSKNTDVIKTSRRDFPYVLSKGLSGGTTVSGTMVAANLVGIKVFVTGGVGGVHRGGESSMDISADLTELGRTRVAVVCSGIKSILDIGRSLEYLETQGVCVATYGHSKDFPAFYCQKSGHVAPYNVTTPDEAASLIKSLEDLQIQTGVLIAVPVPKEDQLVDDEIMETTIRIALEEAAAKGISGKSVTPFLLQRISDLTTGQSLQTNIALIKNNALIGAKIAFALAEKSGRQVENSNKQLQQESLSENKVFAIPRALKMQPVVIGGSVLDSNVSIQEPFKVEARTLSGKIRQSGGGVGRNIADALGKLNFTPTLVSAVGDDQYGRFLLSQTIPHLDHEGILVSADFPTASYTALLDQEGEFRMGIGDMEIHELITPELISQHLQGASAVILDGNVPLTSFVFISEYCSKFGIPVIFEPTDVNKAYVPFQKELWKNFHLITPNVKELRSIASFIGLEVDSSNDESTTSLEEVVSMATPLAEHIHTVMVTLGVQGLMVVGRLEPGDKVTARYYPSIPADHVLSASGAGDCLAAGVISGILSGMEEPQCVSAGFAAAHDSLRCYSAVPQQFTTPTVSVQASAVRSTLKRSLL